MLYMSEYDPTLLGNPQAAGYGKLPIWIPEFNAVTSG